MVFFIAAKNSVNDIDNVFLFVISGYNDEFVQLYCRFTLFKCTINNVKPYTHVVDSPYLIVL